MSFAQLTGSSSDANISIEQQHDRFPQYQRQLSSFRSISSSASSEVGPLKPLPLPLSPRFISATGNSERTTNYFGTGNSDKITNFNRQMSQPLRSTPSLAPITRAPLSVRNDYQGRSWMDTRKVSVSPRAAISTPAALIARQRHSSPPGCIQEDEDVALVNNTITSQYEQQSTGYDSDMDSVYLPEPTSDEATVTSQKSPMTSNKQGSSLVLDLRSLYSKSYNR